MVAGRGIVHSERAGDDLDSVSRLHGIQSWMALPDADEECAPDFVHYPADELPEFERDGVHVRVIIGAAWGQESPVRRHLPTLYLECRFAANAVLTLPADYDELAVYVVSGDIDVGEHRLGEGRMAVACAGAALRISATTESRVMVIGGSHPGKRHIWWNFVSSSKQRIEQGKDDWRENRFPAVPDDDEIMPLPD